ncbi:MULTISPECIES: aldo/keto reductase [unclassified Crossiella]|uniref:aldo/keto reductase n=1 Tax=unclassified Crossiella TaxID=2620835 RepID=UPI001FFE3379|nr:MULTISPECIES: aldo/keto reductase [unclassified Crossiella]MCK2245438.1 aldo/keto reductase [Crossiella sp. S99.2]MCK2259090.1 aldo/keto reductase [Crossiella sp. S99.1]
MRALDTAYNYRNFTSHRTLSSAASDLLQHFTISTKVGFMPGPNGTPRHTLSPPRLREAIDRTVETLGVRPEVIFLHNPERALDSEVVDPASRIDHLDE